MKIECILINGNGSMLPLFLTSNGLYEDDVFIEFLKVVEDHKIQKKICFITTAIRKRDRAFHQEKTEKLFNKAGFKSGFYRHRGRRFK